MAGPSISPGRQLGTPHIIDVTPTILHLLGLSVPTHVEGRSLL
jgi:arylsulfatase A-like enzyme